MPPGSSSTSFLPLFNFSLISKVNSQNTFPFLCPSLTFLAILHLLLAVYRIFLGDGRLEHLAWLLRRRSEWGVCLSKRINVWQGKCIFRVLVHSPGRPFHDVFICCRPVEILADFHLFCTTIFSFSPSNLLPKLLLNVRHNNLLQIVSF